MRAFALLLLAPFAIAQAPANPPNGTSAQPALPDLGPPAAVPDGAPPHLLHIDRDGLRTHAYWLADDARAGRYTQSAGQQATAKYVAEHFQRLGLRPLGDKKGFLQSYPVVRTGLEAATWLTFGTTKITADFAVLAASRSQRITLGGKFVFCGNGTDEQVPKELTGSLPLVVLEGGGEGGGAGRDLQAIQRYKDIANRLGRNGATAGVVCLLADGGSFGNTLNYHAFLPDHARLDYQKAREGLDLRAALFVLSAAQSEKLLQHCGHAAGRIDGKATGKLSIVVKQDEKAQATNVIAVLEGTTKKSEALVISAHHDHVGRRLDGDVFNGADDNASGTAGLLELAEAFVRGERPARSIVFLSVSGEELGLWGSDWYASHPTWPLAKIIANINIDMIGRAGGTDTAIAMQVTPSHQHEKYSTLVQDGVRLSAHFGITFTSGDTYYARSDHYNFAKHGIPVVFFCDGEHPDYHQVTDTADKLDYMRMEAVARLAFWTSWNAAEAKDRPKELGPQPGW